MPNNKYDFRKIEIGLNLLFNNDGFLLERDVSERAITHKLAEHLQKLFSNWDVDCEYNKNLNGKKYLNIEPEKLLREMADYLQKNKSGFGGRKIPLNDNEIRHLINQLRESKIDENIQYIE